jgi:oligopeptide transport system substrate-binding protein
MALIKEQWEATFRIRCELIPLTWDRLFSVSSRKDFQVRSDIWEPKIGDPIYTLNAFIPGGRNSTSWNDLHYRKIVHEAEKEIDLCKKHQKYAQAEERLIDEMPIAPVFLTSSFSLKRRSMQIGCSLDQLDFKWCQIVREEQ